MDGVNYGSGRSGGGGGGGGGVGGGGGGGGGGFARKRWKCLRCQHRNSSADEDCRVAKLAMGNQRGRFSAEDTDLTNAVIITGSSGSGGTTEYFLKCAHCDLLLRNARADAESVIGYEPKLSLAQRRGLVERPEPKLSDDQWDKIEEMTRRRGDHVRLCAICQQKFGASEQIILSCSHIFHRKCLLSFERFVKSRQRRCCPICRKANYQKRVSHAGFFDSRTEAARAFQRLFRGFRERVAHDARRRRLYQSGAKGAYDPALRRKYIFSSVQNVSTKLETAVARREGSVETALAMADKALAASRSFFRTLGVGGAAACSGSAGGSDAGAGATGAGADYGSGGTATAASTVDEEGFWRRIAHTTRARGDDDCAICLCELRGAGDNEEGDVGSSSGGGGGDDGSGGDSHQQPPRRLVLLNCSHVFHQPCLKAYENFNVYDVQLCPTCRAAYRKRVMPMHEFFAE